MCDSLFVVSYGLAMPLSSDLFGLTIPGLTPALHPISYSIARARAAMLNSMSSEGRMSFSYVKQKSEDSPKVSGHLGDAEVCIILFLLPSFPEMFYSEYIFFKLKLVITLVTMWLNKATKCKIKNNLDPVSRDTYDDLKGLVYNVSSLKKVVRCCNHSSYLY